MSWMSLLAKKYENTPKNAKKQPKRILKIKTSTRGGPGFTFSLPGGGSPPCPPVSYATASQSNICQGMMN